MLLINTKAGQQIIVGKNGVLTVDLINEDDHVTMLRYATPEGALSWKTKVGKLHTLGQHVYVMVTRVNQGREVSVTLGFDAPRRIKIRGTWIGEKTRTDYVTLKGMPPGELIVTAEREAQTDLERILLDTLKLVY